MFPPSYHHSAEYGDFVDGLASFVSTPCAHEWRSTRPLQKVSMPRPLVAIPRCALEQTLP